MAVAVILVYCTRLHYRRGPIPLLPPLVVPPLSPFGANGSSGKAMVHAAQLISG